MQKRIRKTTKIGVFLDIPGLARSRAISGLYRFARRKPDWRIFQFPIQRKGEALRRLVASFNPDAIFTGHADAVKAYGGKIPYVLLENIEPSLTLSLGATLNVDNIQLGRTAAEKLYSLGYRNFGYLGIVFSPETSSGDMLSRYSKIRCGAFERRVGDFGFPISSYMPKRGSPYDESAIIAWLKSLKKPCGLLAFSDEDAQYIISICYENRIPVPKQIGVIGIDNEEYICDNVVPPLTSIEPDYEGAGYRAGELLDEFLAGNRSHAGAKELYGVATIQNRMSAQSITSAANRTAHALEMIRADPANAPDPATIARRMNLSLRILELAFKQIQGHSITTEILSQRLLLAKRLLKTSRLSIGEIAANCGFASHASFLASFRRRFGLTPREWRNS